MVIHLEISYDLQTKRVDFRYSMPDLFTEKRDFLYMMLERTKEECLLQQLGAGREHETLPDSDKVGSFGKGEKTDVDGLR